VQAKVPHPVCSDASLFFLADVPHLIKNLKQAFLTHMTIVLYKDIVEKYSLPSNCISLYHVQDLMKFHAEKQLKLAPRLTDYNIISGSVRQNEGVPCLALV
jgi:hypothetical protein